MGTQVLKAYAYDDTRHEALGYRSVRGGEVRVEKAQIYMTSFTNDPLDVLRCATSCKTVAVFFGVMGEHTGDKIKQPFSMLS